MGSWALHYWRCYFRVCRVRGAICNEKSLGKSAESYNEEGIEPEFVRMSQRPGIGATWFDKYQSDVFPNDFTVIRNGIKSKPPRYYTNKYFLSHPLNEEDIKKLRIEEANKRWQDNEPLRLKVRERVKKAQIRSLLRKLS